MLIVDFALVVTGVTIVVNCIVLHHILLCAPAGYKRSDGATTLVARRWRNHGWLTSSKLKILVPGSLMVIARGGWKVTWVSRLLAVLLLHNMSVPAKLINDLLILRCVLWKTPIQCAQAVPHVTVGHAHTVHERKTLLTGRQCDAASAGGSMLDELESSQVGVHGFAMSPSERPEIQHSA